jgi:hypothetical protein
MYILGSVEVDESGDVPRRLSVPSDEIRKMLKTPVLE